MNTSQVEFKKTGHSQADQLESLFQSRPGEWISMTDIGRELGCWAVHSRVADVRRRVEKAGGRVENHVQVDPLTRKRHSFYRFTPNPELN